MLSWPWTEARQAYVAALAAYGDVPDKRQLLQMKIDDLADAAVDKS